MKISAAAVPAPTLQELGAPAQSLRSNDAQHVRDQVAFLLRGWIHICREGSHTNDKTCARYLQLMQENGMLRGDENADRFFRITAELSIETCLTKTKPQAGADGKVASKTALSYEPIDAFAKLLIVLVKYADSAAKVGLLSKVLSVVARVQLRAPIARQRVLVEPVRRPAAPLAARDVPPQREEGRLLLRAQPLLRAPLRQGRAARERRQSTSPSGCEARVR